VAAAPVLIRAQLSSPDIRDLDRVDNLGGDMANMVTLLGMTIDADSAQFEPLLTERDMIDRITDLLAPASSRAQLWVLLLDGLRRQTPLMMPVEDCPTLPDPALLDGLAGVLAGAVAEVSDGQGSVIFVFERLGADHVTAQDHCWAAGLAGACDRAGVSVTGMFVLGPHRVLPVSP
jgi:hypothetical protein